MLSVVLEECGCVGRGRVYRRSDDPPKAGVSTHADVDPLLKKPL
jgi:hypothetical protein